MHRPRILVVDDDPLIRDMVTRNLEAERYEVSVAIDGQSCIEQSLADPPDLVLLHIHLSDCDAGEVTRRLRAEPATQSIPIILLTAFEESHPGSNGNGNSNGNGQLNGNTLDLDAADYVAKPFSPDMLRSKVRHVLEHHGN